MYTQHHKNIRPSEAVTTQIASPHMHTKWLLPSWQGQPNCRWKCNLTAAYINLHQVLSLLQDFLLPGEKRNHRALEWPLLMPQFSLMSTNVKHPKSHIFWGTRNYNHFSQEKWPQSAHTYLSNMERLTSSCFTKVMYKICGRIWDRTKDWNIDLF